MTLEEHYEIERAEGREEGMAAGLEIGREEGRNKERMQMVRNSLKYGNSVEQTALILGLPVGEVMRLSKMQ